MAKNFHINGQFRPLESRENFSLKTYDIPGEHREMESKTNP